MSGTTADREGGPKDTSSAEQRKQQARDAQIAQGLEPDRSEKDALAHRGGPLVKEAERLAAVPGVVIEPTEEAA